MNSEVEKSGRSGGGSEQGPDERNTPELRSAPRLRRVYAAIGMLAARGRAGAKKLSLVEALKAAQQEGDDLLAWGCRGAPVGRVDVRVNGCSVMRMLPAQEAEINYFSFNVPSPKEALLQVIEISTPEKPVVLLNLPLQLVTLGELVHGQLLPNGETLTVKIRLGASGRFRVKVSFSDEEEDVENPSPTEGKNVLVLPEPSTHTGGFQSWMQMSGASTGIYASLAFLLAALTFVCALAMSSTTGAPAMAPPTPVETARPPEAKVAVLEQPAGVDVSVGTPAEAPPARKESGKTEKPPPPKNTARDGRRRRAARNLPANALRPAARGAGASPTVLVNVDPTPWDAVRMSRLAGVQSVYIERGKSPTASEEIGDTLVRSFILAAKNTSSLVVLGDADKDRADATIAIHFEPDVTCLGAVFAYVRDRAGNFLWQGHVGCRQLQDKSLVAMLGDASTRLIVAISGSITAAQGQVELSGGAPDQAAAQDDDKQSSNARAR